MMRTGLHASLRNQCTSPSPVTVAAPTGFLHYSWTPQYQIDHTNTHSVTLSPEVDTKYYVRVEKSPGCFGYDSLLIGIKHPLPLRIGNDTSFCEGTSAIFTTGSAFDQPQWSTGSVAPSITVDRSGTYSVQAIGGNHCLSYDTVTVQVYTVPMHIANDTSFCAGGAAILQVGAGFLQQVWSTGSSDGSITVSRSGRYSVVATATNGCISYDTVQVRVHANPVVALPRGWRAVCRGCCGVGCR